MKKAKNRTATTIIVMTLLAIIILLFYFYWSNRTTPLEGTTGDNLTEVQKLINKDLKLYYPETPREVVKLFSSMMKGLYDNPKDEEVEALAVKIRELYDDELLLSNPQEVYLQNLYTDLALWKEKDRRITNYLLANEDMEKESEIEGVKYSINFVSFTIQESVKFTETWKILLRQDKDKNWKILGWQVVTKQ